MYSTKDGNINIQILADKDNETIWLNQKQLAELFDTTKQNISLHINNILKEKELNDMTVKEILTVVNKGFRGEVEEPIRHYNLDMIISSSI